nr:uncharacterized protein CI109_005923 [Kwoniella shandongensis]KAA5525760.1 hypothetical protein CI109_005923 [Kwoniella shandongensis]
MRDRETLQAEWDKKRGKNWGRGRSPPPTQEDTIKNAESTILKKVNELREQYKNVTMAGLNQEAPDQVVRLKRISYTAAKDTHSIFKAAKSSPFGATIVVGTTSYPTRGTQRDNNGIKEETRELMWWCKDAIGSETTLKDFKKWVDKGKYNLKFDKWHPGRHDSRTWEVTLVDHDTIEEYEDLLLETPTEDPRLSSLPPKGNMLLVGKAYDQ